MRSFAIYRCLASASTAIAAVALLLPATTLAAAGSLDRSFHGNGRLTIPVPRYVRSHSGDLEVTQLTRAAMASAPGPRGELVVADDRRVLRYRADGSPRKRFGGNGRVMIPVGAGMSFQFAGVAVDSRGRVLVAGTTEPIGATGGSQHTRAGVYRFTPDGKLDRKFGKGGVGGASLGPMNVTGLAVDFSDRPVLTALSALTPSFCNKTPVYLNTTAVARLTSRGAPDPTFGDGDGVFTDPLEDPHLPRLNADGGVVYVSVPEHRCDGFEGHEFGHLPEVSILTPGGDLLRRFSFLTPTAGAIFDSSTSIAVDRQNRIVILTTSGPPEGGGISQALFRLLPDGNPDPEFGGQYSQEPGVASVQGPPGRSWAIATDKRNRVIVAGSFLRREGRFVASGFVAERLNAAGRQQAWFGDDGAVKVKFGRHAEAAATQAYLDSRGRIVLSGLVSAPGLPHGRAFALVRLLSGRR